MLLTRPAVSPRLKMRFSSPLDDIVSKRTQMRKKGRAAIGLQ